MSDNSSPSPTTTGSKKPSHENALQDNQLANEISDVKSMLRTITTQRELAAALEPLGYDEEEIKAGTTLQVDADVKFAARQEALAVAVQDKARRDKADQAVTEEFSTYRQTVQACFKGADRAILGASGRISEDIEAFDTLAHSAYKTALTEPYASVLAKKGFKPARIEAALAALDELATINTTSKASHKAAIAATKARDAARKKMNDWAAGLRKIARANLRKRTDLVALLGA